MAKNLSYLFIYWVGGGLSLMESMVKKKFVLWNMHSLTGILCKYTGYYRWEVVVLKIRSSLSCFSHFLISCLHDTDLILFIQWVYFSSLPFPVNWCSHTVTVQSVIDDMANCYFGLFAIAHSPCLCLYRWFNSPHREANNTTRSAQWNPRKTLSFSLLQS